MVKFSSPPPPPKAAAGTRDKNQSGSRDTFLRAKVSLGEGVVEGLKSPGQRKTPASPRPVPAPSRWKDSYPAAAPLRPPGFTPSCS